MSKALQKVATERFHGKAKGEVNPFPGLRPFTINETHLFFGREGQSDEVLLKLAENKFVGIIGSSGSGKSSFIFCGVIPILYGGFLANNGSNWNVIISKPGNSPIDNLANAILENDNSFQNADPEGRLIKKAITSSVLRSSSLGLVEAIYQLKEVKSTNYLILIDQFEELFRFKKSAEGLDNINEAMAFIDLLMEAVKFKDAPIYIAITMRSDFIGECSQYPDLTKYINSSNYLIPQMTREQKKMAITGPVAVGGGQITSRLIQKLLNDLGDNPDQLPILQHALMRTWNFWKEQTEETESLDLKHYNAIGGMDHALSQHADEAYKELSESQKRICESLFKSLTEKDSDNQGIRTPTPLGEIAAIAQASVEEVKEVIEKFRAPGRSLLTPPASVPLDSETIIDISHESLMRIWARLKNWVDDEGEALKIYKRLSEAAEMYQKGKAGLWRPPDLQLALNWKEKYNPTIVWAQRYDPAFERTMVFLEYSKKEFETGQKIKEMLQKRALRRVRTTALVLGTFVIISVGFLVWAIREQLRADKEAGSAMEQKKLAEERSLAAERAKFFAEAQKIIADKERELANRARRESELEGQKAKISEEEAKRQKDKAEANALLALEQKKIAEEQTLLATIKQKEAEEQKHIADSEREKAYKLRLLSIAQSMAVKSVQLMETDLKGLVAQQAYLFNSKNGGDPYHPDIYTGLYYATKQVEGEYFNILDGHSNPVRSIITSQSTNLMFSTGSDGKILQWETNNAKKGAKLIIKNTNEEGHVLVNRTLALSNDNKMLVCGGEYPFIQLFNLANKEMKPVVVEGINGEAWFLGFTPDNKGLIIASSEHQVLYYDFKEIKEISSSVAKITAMCVSPKDNLVAIGNELGQMFIVNISTGKQSLLYEDEDKKSIHSLSFNKSGKLLAAGDDFGIVRIFDATTGKIEASLTRHRSRVNDIKFSPDGKLLATASWDGTVRLWNFSNLNNQPIELKDQGKDWVWGISFSEDSRQIFAACKDNKVRIWPTTAAQFADKLCGKLARNMTRKEWDLLVAADIPYSSTCPAVK
ncbi:MAG TPA: High-affnity carbon uptake protein Hat/HatR [Cytophagales bacterium]|nr:High-affnity carbon uptake protein Hat/HatR [Cytophagales bacterium]